MWRSALAGRRFDRARQTTTLIRVPDIDIEQLVWDDWNRQHIWDRHRLTPEIVEEVCHGHPNTMQVRQTYGDRYLVLGPRRRGTTLFAVVLAQTGPGQYYPVSARRASVKERQAYRAWKAGAQE